MALLGYQYFTTKLTFPQREKMVEPRHEMATEGYCANILSAPERTFFVCLTQVPTLKKVGKHFCGCTFENTSQFHYENKAYSKRT